jgi:hypothetical protein
MNKEFRRMMELAGLAGLAEMKVGDPTSIMRKYMLLYKQYKSKMESIFDLYKITNEDSFWGEVDNSDMMNSISFELAQEDGFEGDFGDYYNTDDPLPDGNYQFYDYLSYLFTMHYAKEIGLISGDESKWKYPNKFLSQNSLESYVKDNEKYRKNWLNEMKIKDPNLHNIISKWKLGYAQDDILFITPINNFKPMIDGIVNNGTVTLSAEKTDGEKVKTFLQNLGQQLNATPYDGRFNNIELKVNEQDLQSLFNFN